jgi:hypothetical protein
MQTQYISFCGQVALNIKKKETKQSIINDLDEIKIIDKHHEKFNADYHMNRLKKVPHLVGIKSNGNPYYMFLTKLNLVNSVIMIDKKVQMGYDLPRMIIIRLNFDDESLFDNSLLEGEMICDKNNKWFFLISDIRILRNKSTKHLDLCKRMNTIYEVLDKHFKPSFQDLFTIQVKKYVQLNEINDLHDNFIPTLSYTCRGLYLKPLYTKFMDILINFDDSLIKSTKKESYKNTSHFLVSKEEVVKPNISKNNNNEKHQMEIECCITTTVTSSDSCCTTFNLQKTTTPDVYTLYDIKTDKKIGNACVNNLNTSKMLSNHFSSLSLLEKSSFMCERTNNTNFNNIWVPIKFLPNV